MPAQPRRRPAGPQTAAALRSGARVALRAPRDQPPQVRRPEARRASPPRSPNHPGSRAMSVPGRQGPTYLGALPRITDRVIDSAVDIGHEVLVKRRAPQDLQDFVSRYPCLPPVDRHNLGDRATANSDAKPDASLHGSENAADVVPELALRDLADGAGAPVGARPLGPSHLLQVEQSKNKQRTRPNGWPKLKPQR